MSGRHEEAEFLQNPLFILFCLHSWNRRKEELQRIK